MVQHRKQNNHLIRLGWSRIGVIEADRALAEYWAAASSV